MRGRIPKPTAVKIFEGNPGKRKINGREPKPAGSLPDCPDHLMEEAKAEWHRIAASLNVIGLLTQVDRATMAAYCQCWARWVEAERKLAETPAILRMPSGYIQQSPWLSIANKQLELMAKYMAELGLTPASRSRLAIQMSDRPKPWEYGGPNQITRVIIEPQFASPKRGPDWDDAPRPGDVVISAKDATL
jgi:P27 family predicted phage terminase small subunit